MISKLVEEAASGKEVIIARGDVPVARLIAIQQPKRRKARTLKGKLTATSHAFDPLSEKQLRELGFE